MNSILGGQTLLWELFLDVRPFEFISPNVLIARPFLSDGEQQSEHRLCQRMLPARIEVVHRFSCRGRGAIFCLRP